MRKFHSLAGGRDSWQQVIPLCVVSEAQNEFVYDLIFPDGTGDGRHRRIFGNLVYEVLAVKAADTLPTEPAGHGRDAVHVRFGNHCFHGALNIKIGKLSGDMLVEERAEIGRSI